MVKTIVVTGGAGRIAYSLIPQLCDGSIFGESLIHLNLLDIEISAGRLNGVKMEIEDSCYERVISVTATTDPQIAFKDADVVIILGGYPRSPGMERKDLIGINAKGMKVQAEALNQYAHHDCKVLIIANPCNTNCLVMRKIATNIPPENFSCLTRLDQERLCAFIIDAINDGSHLLANVTHFNIECKCNSLIYISKRISPKDIRNVIIWGNHSNTQVPDVTNIEINVDHKLNNNVLVPQWTPISDILDMNWLVDEIIPRVQKRGAEVMNAQGASSGMSAANAIAKHLKDWFAIGAGRKRGLSDIGQGYDTEKNVFSMGMSTDNNPYNIPPGLIFSFPCTFNYTTNSNEIVPGFHINSTLQNMIDKTVEELVNERKEAEDIVGNLR
eukprot:TRINITY_DN78009_c0_g1_i1.p1 TRINITY_DN78009_c0_g1~~TRINITY_DN78009_c0_g1_i1.p1  ORF type:complete len:385 (-),score=-26.47 TRINITY_DN78009_c0_g1_i1:32-1186(-)